MDQNKDKKVFEQNCEFSVTKDVLIVDIFLALWDLLPNLR